MVNKMQVLRMNWFDMKPLFVVSSPEGEKRIPLFGHEFSYDIGAKHCVGFWKGGFQPCPDNAIIKYGNKCQLCEQRDDYYRCIQCDGSKCINPEKRADCEKEKFYIYLAAFNSMLKVGISRDTRLLTRLVEQGCDFGAKVFEVPDGMTARQVEQKISSILGITDRLKGEHKFVHLFSNPNQCIANIDNAINRLRLSDVAQYMVVPEIFDLRRYYKLDGIKETPVLLSKIEGRKVCGKISAVKGNLLVLENYGKDIGADYVAMNAHDLVGRVLEPF